MARLLIVIGLAMTAVMQSSTAAIAVTLSARFAGAVGLDQACALIIGQNSARRQVKLWLQSAQTAPPSDWLISIVYIGRKRKTATEPLRASLAVGTQRRDRKGDKTGNRRFVPLDRRGTRRTHGLDEYLALTGRRHSLFFDL